MLPEESVVRTPPAPCDAQLKLASLMPPEKVEVAVDVLRSEPPVIVRPLEEASPPVEIPPMNVEVAVEVALIEAKLGVVVPTTFPDESVERTILFPTLAKFKLVPALNVRVPEVKLSEVSERRNERESIPSNVVASPPELVRQEPFGIWKQPAERAMPFANEEVAVEVLRSVPPVISIPVDDLRLVREIPPEKVEVATEVISRLPEDLIPPAVIVSPPVEESPAVARGPAQVEVPTIEEPKVEPAAMVRVVPESKVRVPEVKLSEVSERRNWVESMLSSVLALVVMQLPEESRKQPAVSLSPLLNVEVAPEVKRMLPPVIVRPLEEASPPAEIPPMNVEVAVEVALIEAKLGVVVPTTLPDESVDRTILFPTLAKFKLVPALNVRVPEVKLSEVSERRKERESRPSKVLALVVMQLLEESRKQPPVSTMPLAKEEVAEEVLRRVPPVISMPVDDLRLVRERPPRNVEVAVLVISRLPEDLIEPPEMVRPEAEERPPTDATEIPPWNVEVAVEVALMDAT